MNTRFKFRCFIKKTKKMYDVMEIDFRWQTNEPANVGLDVPDNDGWLLWESLENVILMQCTGLKDKNGKLVYFDDIIKDDIGHRFVITQDLNVNSLDYGSVILHKIPITHDIEYIPTLIAKSEVIGNIYENPELLEVENDV